MQKSNIKNPSNELLDKQNHDSKLKSLLPRNTGLTDNLGNSLRMVGTNKTCPVAFVFKNDQVLIGLRNYTPDKWKTISVWTIPGGRCDEGECIENTLMREIEEEVGITELTINSFLGTVPGAKEGDVVYVFIAETNQEPQLLEPLKFSEWKWSSIDEVPANFINPRALELLKRHINQPADI